MQTKEAKEQKLRDSIPVKDKLLLSAAEAANLCGIGRSLFYSLHSSGELGPEPIRLSSRVLWRRSDLEAWIKGGCKSRSEWLKHKENKL